MATLRITHFTDPNCPFAYSAEPQRRRLQWLYGPQLEWTTRMVGLAESREEYAAKGMTPEQMQQGFRNLHERVGMPFDLSLRPAVPATLPACREIVAVREHAGEELAQRLLRQLRLQQMAFGGVLDELHTLRVASHAAGLDSEQLDGWAQDPKTKTALLADLKAAREPDPISRQLPGKLGKWEGGARYSTPTYLLHNDAGEMAAIPGFQEAAGYDLVFVNFAPDLERAEPAQDAGELLRWAGEPLATAEVAAVMETDLDGARSALAAAGAQHQPAGNDALWTI